MTHMQDKHFEKVDVLVDMSGYPWMSKYGTNMIIVIMCDYKIRVMLSSRHVWLIRTSGPCVIRDVLLILKDTLVSFSIKRTSRITLHA